MRIQPIQPAQFSAALDVMARVGFELWGIPLDVVRQHDPLTDLDDIQSHYLDNRGAFLVILNDEEEVVGTGGIHRIDSEICEFKRLWLLKEYRGQGLGRQLTEALLHAACTLGYHLLRLEIANPELQQAAVKLYEKLGFSSIPQYRPQSSCSFFMEKTL